MRTAKHIAVNQAVLMTWRNLNVTFETNKAICVEQEVVRMNVV